MGELFASRQYACWLVNPLKEGSEDTRINSWGLIVKPFVATG